MSDGGGSADFSSVYQAVAAGESEEELRRVIEACAQGDEQRRAAAANHGETPLQAAHRKERGDLVGALVEAGADVGGIFGGRLTPLAVCIAYGQAHSVRALLRKGHDPNEEIPWDPLLGFGADGMRFCSPAHFALAPAPIGPSQRRGMRQVGCLEVLVKEGGVDVNARDFRGARASLGLFNDSSHSPLMVATSYSNARFARFLIEEAGAPVDECNPRGETALHFCGRYKNESETMTVLLDAGADIDARDQSGRTPLFLSVIIKRTALTRLLLERGASTGIATSVGWTPLLAACAEHVWFSDDEGWPVFQELLRRSSVATRRVVPPSIGYSAVDYLACALRRDDPPSDEEKQRVQERRRWAIAELLVSGVPVLPRYAPVVLPIAAALSAQQHAEMAERRSERRRWCAHYDFVGLSLDHQEMREAEREVEERRARLMKLERAEARRARVAELMRALRELEAEMESGDESGESESSDESESGDGGGE